MLNIPDNLSKILIGIGITLVAFGFIKQQNEEQLYFSRVDSYRNELLNTNELIDKINFQLSDYQMIAKRLSKKNNVENPLIVNDSVITFTNLFSGTENEMKINDSLFQLYLSIKKENAVANSQKVKLLKINDYLTDDKNLYNQNSRFYYALAVLGLLMFFVGFNDLQNQHQKDSLLKFTGENGQSKVYIRCQSCAQKFSSMINYGTNKDGKPNNAFCNSCWKNGEFTEPDLTKVELLKRIKKEGHKIRFLGKKIIHNLDRWKFDKYN